MSQDLGQRSQSPGFWDERFDADEYAYGTEPSSYLIAQAGRLPTSGHALVPGDGEGRNGVWLAERGLDVTTLDLSPAGVAKAKKLAADRGVTIDAQQADVFQWDWPASHFDCIVCVYMHLRPDLRERFHASVVRALAPGGLLVLEAFTPMQLQHDSGGPKQPDMLFTSSMLRKDFATLSELELDELATHLSEGRDHQGAAHVIRGVWRKG